MGRPRRRSRSTPFLSRISTRLLAFNLLVLFLPVGAFLYLDTYERQLLRALEHALVQQGRVLAAALAGGDEPLDAGAAARVLVRLERRHEARLRVVDAAGRLLADSSRLASLREPAATLEPPQEPGAATPEAKAPEPAGNRGTSTADAEPKAPGTGRDPAGSLLYRAASAPVRLYRRLFGPPEPPLDTAEFYVGSDVLLGTEVRDALAGRYGAITRISTGGQRSVTLYTAIPIRSGQAVVGAVVVSQSTYRILQDLYELRLQVFRIFLVGVAVAVALSLVASTTIVVPIGRLRRQAREILDHRGRLRGHFRPPRRKDEIGDLSRALQELTETVEKHLRFMEAFAADLSHEIRNPLATIRSAAEMLGQTEDPEERRRFLAMIQGEVARTQALASAVREISRIDAQLEQEARERLDLAELAERAVEALRLRYPQRAEELRVRPRAAPEGDGASAGARGPGSQPVVRMAPERAAQVLENLLDNAAGLSGGEVEVVVQAARGSVRLAVLDRGPGIPEAHLERVFDRFFSFRPGVAGERHLGLGLAIVKAIVEAYDGRVTASNRPGGGACVEVLLPADPNE